MRPIVRAFMNGLTSGADPAPPARLAVVHFPLHCSAFGGVSIVEAVCAHGTCVFRRNVPPEDVGQHAGTGQGLAELGRYRIDFGDWPGCARCGACGIWQCAKPRCAGAFHCFSQRRPSQRLLGACGQLCGDRFEEKAVFDMHGAAAPVTANPAFVGRPLVVLDHAELSPPLRRLPPR